MSSLQYGNYLDLGFIPIDTSVDIMGSIVSWLPGMKTDIADWYFICYNAGDIRNYLRSGGNPDKMIIHFLSYDIGIINPLWSDFGKRIEKMKVLGIKKILAPDFSSWANQPITLQLFNYYKSNVVTRDLQQAGFEVIPNPCWSHTSLMEISIEGMWGNHSFSIIDCDHNYNDQTIASLWFWEGLRKYRELFPEVKCGIYTSSKSMAYQVNMEIKNCFWIPSRGVMLRKLISFRKKVFSKKGGDV